MKAAHNGVPCLSVLDGWWCEGHAEGGTGGAIGAGTGSTLEVRDDAGDAEDLYRKLESKIMPLFYGNRTAWATLMRSTISQNAAMFNAHRMFLEYLTRAYREEETSRG